MSLLHPWAFRKSTQLVVAEVTDRNSGPLRRVIALLARSSASHPISPLAVIRATTAVFRKTIRDHSSADRTVKIES